ISDHITSVNVLNTGGAVTVVSAAKNKLEFTTQPSAAVVAGVSLATQPIVTIQDQYGNTATTVNDTIVLEAHTNVGCSAPSGTGLQGTISKAAVTGVTTYTDVNHEKMETIYLKASSGVLNVDCSNAIAVDHAAAAALSFATQPATTGVADVALTTQPEIEILDAFGNLVNDGTHNITLSAYTTPDCSTTASGGTFTQTTKATASGSGTFVGTKHDTMETIYLKADDGAGLTDTCSNAVAIDHSSAAAIHIATQPSGSVVSGVALATQPVVEIHDAFGNIVDDGSFTVDALAYTTADCSTTPSVGTLNLTNPTSSTGTAAYTNIDHEKMETIYLKLQDTSDTLTSACTSSITVDHAAAAALAINTQPSSAVVAGVALATQPVVKVHDAFGNIVNDGSYTI
ncbi:MAG: hypothetical protein GY893_11705, partial [bacterium]|nr:hypothetical protein [bacterium]